MAGFWQHSGHWEGLVLVTAFVLYYLFYFWPLNVCVPTWLKDYTPGCGTIYSENGFFSCSFESLRHVSGVYTAVFGCVRVFLFFVFYHSLLSSSSRARFSPGMYLSSLRLMLVRFVGFLCSELNAPHCCFSPAGAEDVDDVDDDEPLR